ncbi:hypothetical protein EDB84DRAFT_1617424 [Lactarius hengduanensis]|nr:hypothetical protein EDB84DRAFT_1617424 [Lactarius hengduanensis]
MPHQPYQMGYLMSSSADTPEPPLRQADPASLPTGASANAPKSVAADPMPSFPSQDEVAYTQSLVGDDRLAPSPDDTNLPHPPLRDLNDPILSHRLLDAGVSPNRPKAGDTAVTDMGDHRYTSTSGGEGASDGGPPSPPPFPHATPEGRQPTVVKLPAPSPIAVSSGSREPGMTRAGPDDPIRGVQALSIPDDSVASAERALSYLSEELSLIVTGYGHYYMGGRELALQKYSAVTIETPLLRRAIATVTALLDLGVQNETSGAEVGLTTSSWFRLARLALAAIMRGANRSEGLEKAGDAKLRPCLDVFRIHEQLTVPETEIESLRMMAEQLAGKFKGERGLGGGDANPETVYDAIISKRMANFEARAEAEERLKAVEWTATLRARLEDENFDTFLLSLQKDMEGHEYTVEVRKNFMNNLLTLWTGRREAILQDVESQFREEARRCKEDERSRLIKQAIEEGRVEAARGAEAELTVWKQTRLQELKNDALEALQHEALKVNDSAIEEWRLGELVGEKERHLEAAKASIEEHVKGHYDAFKTEALDSLRLQARRDAEAEARQEKVRIYNKKVAQHEQTIQRALREESRPLLLKVARELGMAISAEDSTALVAAAPPKPREGVNTGTKRKTSDQQVDDATERGRSHSRAPAVPIAPASAAKVAGIYGGEIRTPSATSSAHKSKPDAEGSMPTNDPAGPAEMVNALALPAAFADEEARGVGSSIFNPSNAMPVDETSPPPTREASPTRAAPQDFFGSALGELSAEQRFMLSAIQRLIEPVTERLFVVEKKLTAQEQQGAQRPQASRPPTVPNQNAPTLRPATSAAPPARGPAAPARSAAVPAGEDDGIIPVRASTWATMAAKGKIVTQRGLQQHQHAETLARGAAAAQGRTPTGQISTKPGSQSVPLASTTEVTILRDGGFLDRGKEEELRGRHPQSIVMEVRTLLEKSTRSPVKVLGGRWSSNYQKTGNFVFVLAGDVPVEVMSSFEKWLCAPFPGSALVPTKGWTWAQMRGVPTTDDKGRVWEMDELLEEACSNTVLGKAYICSAPRWQIEPAKIMTETATVLIAYADPKGEVTRQALTEGIWMFGNQVKFVRAGNKPTLIQCGRCHELGHNRSSRLCKLPKNALRCHRCGGGHHSDQHDFECKAIHAVAGTCDCRLKCILCGKTGHNARSRDCHKRGDFAPPRLARNPNAADAGALTGADEQGFVTVTRSRPRARRVLPGAIPANGSDDIEAMMAAGRNRADLRAQTRVGDNPPVDGSIPVTGLRDEPTQNPRQQAFMETRSVAKTRPELWRKDTPYEAWFDEESPLAGTEFRAYIAFKDSPQTAKYQRGNEKGRVFDKVSRMLALPWSAKGLGASLEEFVAASPAREDVAPLMPRALRCNKE